MNMIIISGPPGSGKHSLAKRMVKNHPTKYEIVKAVTTSTGNRNDEECIFVSNKNFKILEKAGNFLATTICDCYGSQYGIPIDEVIQIQNKKKVPILIIDGFNKKQIEEQITDYEIFSIFVKADAEQIFKRLLARGESVESIIKLMNSSIEEAKQCVSYDAIISNNDPGRAAEQIEAMSGMNETVKDTIQVHQYIADASRMTRILGDKDSLNTLMLQVDQFCRIRNRDKYNSPKDLAIGISTEANELLRMFRFKTDQQINSMMVDDNKREDIERQIGDIFFFLLRFCGGYGFNPGEILVNRILRDEE